MALLTTATIAVGGTVETLQAAAVGGDTANVGGFLAVKNGSGSSVTVTLATPGNLPTGDAYPDKVVTVAAGATTYIPLLRLYRDKTDGLVHITYSSVTSVTVGAFAI